jgi:prepilin-type N-terminal cleavage/methylation domain-containing protein
MNAWARLHFFTFLLFIFHLFGVHMSNETCRRRGREGFTLIELLTVIGIMCILMGILLPSISTLWKASKNASTWSEINSIATAINHYKETEGTYPGPIPENQIFGFGLTAPVPLGLIAGTPPTPPPPNSAPNPLPTNMTSTENMLLGILGGVLPSTAPPKGFYDQYQIPRGPYNLNPVSPQQIKAYYDVPNGDLSVDNSGNLTSWTKANNPTAPQLDVPELLDHYYNPRPIIYVRAQIAAPSIVDVGFGPPNPPGGSQYYSAELSPYWIGGSKDTSTNVFTPNPGNSPFPSYSETSAGLPTLASAYLTPISFFQNPALNDGYTPRAKDAFMLISAGVDGQYGTKDDIVWPRAD